MIAQVLTDALKRDISDVARISSVPEILKLVSELTGMRFTLVARVTPDSWTACAVYDQLEFGLKAGGQLDVATTLCKEVHDNDRAIFIPAVSKDDLYRNHHTPRIYQLESYFAIPIAKPEGGVFGTLCGIDRKAVNLPPAIIGTLTMFAKLIESQLRVEEERDLAEKLLREERRLSKLREEFIAVLGHDLRSPLGGIAAIADVLTDLGQVPAEPALIRGLRESCEQMARLIDDVLDFARGRLGGGLSVEKEQVGDLGVLVEEVVTSQARLYPARSIRIQRPGPVAANVDTVRFRQIITNLVGNALQHSPPDAEVSIRLESSAERVNLAVTNQGNPIPPELKQDLFRPFNRKRTGNRRAGLGLGLYICSEIVRAHGGTIVAESAASGTTFVVSLPA